MKTSLRKAVGIALPTAVLMVDAGDVAAAADGVSRTILKIGSLVGIARLNADWSWAAVSR